MPEQREEARRERPEHRTGQTDKRTEIDPLPGVGCGFVGLVTSEGLGRKRIHTARNAERQSRQGKGDDAARHGRRHFGGADQGNHPGIDKAHDGE